MARITDDLRRIIEEREPQQVEVVLEPRPGQGQAVADTLRERGISFRSQRVGDIEIFRATLSPEQVFALEGVRVIEMVDHSPRFQPLGSAAPGIRPSADNTEFSRRTITDAISAVELPEAWQESESRGEGKTIGIVDTPTDPDHPMIEDAIRARADVGDPEDHGTWVAGAAAGRETLTDEGTLLGAAPQADLVTHGALGGGIATISDVAEGVEYCLQHGADYINMSFGGPHTETMHSIVKEVRRQGVVPVCAAGNAGPGNYTITCPGHHTEAFTVAATGLDGSKAAFSSRGPGWNEVRKPDVAAPGGDAETTPGFGTGLEVTEAIYGPGTGGEYVYLLGTSMAAPIITGALAVLGAQPDP